MSLKLPKLQSVPFYPSSPLLPQNNCKLTVLTFLTHLPAQPCPTASYEKLKTNRPNYFGRGVGVGGQTWQDLLHLFFEGRLWEPETWDSLDMSSFVF